jgi:hypothetical protein
MSNFFNKTIAVSARPRSKRLREAGYYAAVSASAIAAQSPGFTTPAGVSYFEEIRGPSDDILGIKALYDLNIVQTAAVGETEETVKDISEILRHLWLINIGTEDEPIMAIRSDLGIYSDSFLTAGGAFPGEEGGSGGLTEIPIASETVLGGIRTGYIEALVESNLCLAVRVTEDGKAYVQVPMGTSDSVVAPGNHMHSADNITSGTLDIARIPTGTTSVTVALGNHTHNQYAAASHNHSAAQITSGTLAIARIPTGTTSSTVALGNHTHTGYAAASHEHSAAQITSGTLAIDRIPTGTTSSTVALGNHTHTGYAAASHEHSAAQITSGTLAIARIPTGTTSTTVALGNHTHTEYAALSHNHSADQITSGTLALARIPTGTTSTTVALGDHTHSQYMLTASFSAQAIVEKLGITPVNRATGDADGNTISSSYLKLSGGTLTGDLTAQNITPAANATYNLGTKVKCWKHGYLTRWYPKPNDETVYIEFDTTKSAFKIVGNIYSTGAITAGA